MFHIPNGSTFKRGDTWNRPDEKTMFAQWMESKRYTYKQVARTVGSSQRSVKYWAQGQSIPSLLFAFKIEQVSKGKVPVASWLGTALARAKWAASERGAPARDAR